ncbi:MAG: hypothetical protein NVSMB1_00490 [Polyangiales bacterium]
MSWFTALVMGSPVFIALLAWLEVRRAGPVKSEVQTTGRDVRHRSWIAALFTGVAFTTLGPEVIVFLVTGGRDSMPVAPPDGGGGCSGGEPAHSVFAEMTALVAWWLVARIVPLVIAYVVRKRKLAQGRLRPSPSGVLFLRSVLCIAGFVWAAAVVRFAIGGAEPDDFQTFGAFTPDGGIRGFRARWVLSRVVGSPAKEFAQKVLAGEPVRYEQTNCSTHNNCFGMEGHFFNCAAGLRVWVTGKPFFITGTIGVPAKEVQYDSLHAPLYAHEIVDEKPLAVEVNPHHDARPHFERMPEFFVSSGEVVFVEARPDGSVFAVAPTTAATVERVGLLLRAPLWPVAMLAAIALAGGFIVFLFRPGGESQWVVRGGRRDAHVQRNLSVATYREPRDGTGPSSGEVDGYEETPPARTLVRLGYAWALYLATWIVLVVYRPYF